MTMFPLSGKYDSILSGTKTGSITDAYMPVMNSFRYGLNGLEAQPGQGRLVPAPVSAQTPSNSQLPASPEQKAEDTATRMFELLMKQREYENSDEVMARKNKYALELMNAIGDKQMELGWKSNLIGFGLKELPRLMTEPGRRRNRYLDDLVLNTPGIQRNAATALVGQGIPNYAMGI